MDASYPKEFQKSPLADAVIEVRFDSADNKEFVAALIYSRLKKRFPKLEELPILQLPQNVRDAEPSLKYAPTHRVTSDNFYVHMGPNVLGMGCFIEGTEKKYPGWSVFLKQFLSVLSEVEKLQIISKLERLSVRFTNFFQEPNLYDYLNVKLETGWEGQGLLLDKNITFGVKKAEYTSKVRVNTDVYKGDISLNINGQIIDIDTYREGPLRVSDISKVATGAHKCIEQIFFRLINDELKERLGAKYV